MDFQNMQSDFQNLKKNGATFKICKTCFKICKIFRGGRNGHGGMGDFEYLYRQKISIMNDHELFMKTFMKMFMGNDMAIICCNH